MKQIFLILVLFFVCVVSPVYAESDPYNDYTLIDCIYGSDETGIAFDSSLPYQSLKAGIEQSIDYINQNVNISSNAETASGKTFTIKVNCTTNDLLNSQINLNFNGKAYNNELVIEGVGDNGLIIQDMYFYIPNNTGQVIFKNAKFLDNSKFGYYFKPETGGYFKGQSYHNNQANLYNFFGIIIKDSYFDLKLNTQLGLDNSYKIYYSICAYYTCNSYNYNYSYTFNQFIINNSVIEVDINSDYTYKMPFLLKDSKISFNNSGTESYNITFTNNSNVENKNNYGNSFLMSNEIDLGGNNFNTENKTNIAFINNKFSNLGSFNFSGNALYFNNTIENENDINISSSKNLVNNVFSGSFTDTYDKNNLRRNYNLDNIGTKGIGWFFKITSPLKYFDTKVSSYSLYKEITGQDLVENKDGVYVIYNN